MRRPSVTADPLLQSAAEPERLAAFLTELAAAGFVRTGDASWTGPTRQSLMDGGFTDSDRMTLRFQPSWPYLPPLLEVPGISAWHADQERLCLWREDDSSQRWTTLLGLLERIDEWVADALAGFAASENARNPEIYWQDETAGTIVGLVNLDELLGGLQADGQHSEFHFTEARSADGRPSPMRVFDLAPGPFKAATPRPWDALPGRVRGRWFFRAGVPQPPRTLAELRALLTDRQRERLDKDLRDRPLLMFGLVWRNQAGLVATMLLSCPDDTGTRAYALVALRPSGRDALLLRAGPDAPTLQQQTVAVIGAGAVGSFVAEALARAGIGTLLLYDADLLFPANLSRHAAPPGTPAGTRKTDALAETLGLYSWTRIEPHASRMWRLEDLRAVLSRADLTIDATGHGGLAELTARVAADVDRPYLTAALLRGGSVVRVRRQADQADTPLLGRSLHDRYPTIPPLPDELEYVGTEVGCLAQVHNAPPTAVMLAGALTADVAIDLLTGRRQQPDEVIEVLRATDSPFDQLGRLRPQDLPVTVDVTERALAELCARTLAALPNETGGVLLGFLDGERPVVVDAVEHVDPDATPCRYRLPAEETQRIVEEARGRDDRLGYLGDWHTHPSGAGPSDLDTAAMLGARAHGGFERPLLVLGTPTDDRQARLSAYVTTAAGLVEATICPIGDPLPPTDPASTDPEPSEEQSP
jgi:hypothetical protein